MHKEDGICADGPYFTFHHDDDRSGPDGVPRWKAGGLREQNHLSDFVSADGILQGLFGMTGDENAAAGGPGRKGLILTGHDHVGCDIVHYIDRVTNETDREEKEVDDTTEQGQDQPKSWSWAARRFNAPPIEADNTPSIREVTLRSMMGEFGGNAGLLSVWFDAELGEWDYEIAMCPAGVQHIWWAVHVLLVVTVLVGLLWLLAGVVSYESPTATKEPSGPKEKVKVQRSSNGSASAQLRSKEDLKKKP